MLAELEYQPPAQDQPRACPDCLRHSWLLTLLTGYLDSRRHDLHRLTRLFTLSESELLSAVGADKRPELMEEYERFTPEMIDMRSCNAAVCRHDARYPFVLAQAQAIGAPAVLYLSGEYEQVLARMAQQTVAIVGIRKATDYGIEVARSMAHGLTAAGVTVVSGLAEGIAAAAHLGAIDAGGPTVTVMPGGVDICYPANKRSLYESIRNAGCAISEMPGGFRMRRWCYSARNRLVTGLSRMVIVVEADRMAGDLMVANLANQLGKPVAAVPGRVTSTSSRGTHSLLSKGAHLVEGAQDVLDLLYGPGIKEVPTSGPDLEPRLRSILEMIGNGHDTETKLAANGLTAEEALMALTELELMGKITRGDGGRYVMCAGLGLS